MTYEEKKQVAINQIGFEFFTSCIKNGATPDEAKAEMMTVDAQKIISKRVLEVLQ